MKRLVVDAAEVRDVVITHLHYDHVGNFAPFPKSHFPPAGYGSAIRDGAVHGAPMFANAYEVEEVVAMVRRVYEGRVRFHDGDALLAPGLSLHRIGGHTMSLQAVRVHTRVGWIVLASDATHLYGNFEQARPLPVVHDIGAMVEGYRRLRELVNHPRYVVPGHDPLVQRYPAAGPGLDGVAVRLDAEPRV